MPASPGDKVVNLIQTPTIPPCLNLSSAGPSQAPLTDSSAGLGHCFCDVRARLFACDGDGE